MSDEVRTKIPLDTQNKMYQRPWQQTQEELDAYDDLMRRKINYQVPEYVQNNELICFGLSSQEFEEGDSTQWTPKAQRDLNILQTWFKKDKMNDVLTRPVYKSDFNWTNYASRAQVRVLMGLLVIRELPIKNFYIRCWLAYVWCVFFVLRGLGRGLRFNRPIVMYNNSMQAKALANYPDLFYWNITKILPKNPPVPDAHREWRTRQTPVFHQYHKNAYRYRMRKPRYIPWDGSQNQPVMPYMIDIGTDVINGTFKRNVNTVPQLK